MYYYYAVITLLQPLSLFFALDDMTKYLLFRFYQGYSILESLGGTK